MNIPFVDLFSENKLVKDKVLRKISALVESSRFTLGPNVEEFEKNFAKLCDAEFCLGVGSGTDALRTALLACGVTKGDEVITTPITYTSTSLAIAHCGARPVFVDVLKNGNIDPSKIKTAITSKTKAILVVHMYGNPCEMDPIRRIAKRHKLFLIDDCAHSHGAKYKGKPVGSLADISCFSFYPTKNLGAWGDAGAITTSNPKLLEQSMLYKNYGEKIQNFSKVIGYNSKLDTIQAIVLGEKLKFLPQWNKKRSRLARYYTTKLAGVGDITTIPFSSECAYYNFPIFTKSREKFIIFLKKKKISVFIRYPLPAHLQECFKYLGYKRGDFPMAEQQAASVVSLPFYSSLSRQFQDYVIANVREFYGT